MPSQGVEGKKKKKMMTDLTAQQEQEMIDWLREHPVLWNKKLRDYKDTTLKESMWMAQAEKLGKEVQMIKVWYKSIRTRFGRLKNKPSGTGDDELTERDHWILTSCDFLRGHIFAVRQRTVQSVSLNNLFQHFKISNFRTCSIK
jgi:hypothetical protein